MQSVSLVLTFGQGAIGSIALSDWDSVFYKGDGTSDDSTTHPGCLLEATVSDGSTPADKPTITITGDRIYYNGDCVSDCSVTKNLMIGMADNTSVVW